jgi:flagellar biosynthesis protein FlhB
MAEDLGERTEEATPKRRQESRAEGQVARSQDLAGVIVLIAGTVALAAVAFWMLGQSKVVLAAMLEGQSVVDVLDPHSARDAAMYVGAAAVRIAAPFLITAWIAAFLAHFAQIGWILAPKAVMPRFSKLDPISGFRRIFGVSGMVKAVLDSLKVLVVAAVVVLTVRQHADQIMMLPMLSMLEALASTGKLMLDLALRILAVLLALAVLDFAYQKWRHAQELRMTKQQVKDEMKQTEGDPDVKRRRMRMQQQIAMQRISSAVPIADVIVTNPEHISVAIRYDAERMHAPKVVAKGADYLALRIRQLAIRHGVPIVERKPLARALYRDVPVGREIPPDFYAAVAEVLAYVYRLSGRKAG